MHDLWLYFRALSDRKRLRIVRYLALHDAVPVSELGREMRMSQPLISWHLRMLRRAGIVRTRRAGRHVLCSLNRRGLRAYQAQVTEMFELNGTEDAGLGEEPATLTSAGRT